MQITQLYGKVPAVLGQDSGSCRRRPAVAARRKSLRVLDYKDSTGWVFRGSGNVPVTIGTANQFRLRY